MTQNIAPLRESRLKVAWANEFYLLRIRERIRIVLLAAVLGMQTLLVVVVVWFI